MERDESPGRSVGRLLRDQRLARGVSVDDVAARLRIRSRYLEAIEQGNFDQLPGAAYIPAFLRAYAHHLGLDADKVMTAYQLSGPVPIERPVALPADLPLIEKRAPIGLAVLTALLVFGAGYAVWQYMPHQQTVVSEKVPPVPDRLLAGPAPAAPPAVQPAVQPPAAPAVEASAPAPAPAPVQPVQEVRAPSPPPSPAVEMWPLPKQEAAQPAPPVVAAAPPPVVAAAPPPVVAPPPPVVAAPAPAPAVVLPTPSPGQAQAAQAAPVIEAPRPVPTPVVQTAPLQPVQQAAVPTPPMAADTQVFVRTNSWLELRTPAGDVLTQTYVRAGESYTVPAGISYRIIDAR
jgi:cytoskeleton protein RodZ